MTETYIDELQAWVKRREQETAKPRQDSAAVEFVGVKEHVLAARNAGYSLRTIWEHMQATGRFRFGYETFRAHARRLLTGKAKKGTPGKNPGGRTEGKKDAAMDQQVSSGNTENGSKAVKVEIKGFKHNPNPTDEELFG